ncbi:hypothetical protein [uncultured Parabacteroides sp.]|uniref:hypothetical protein n=1 Tax=uncultured Parabacteroides sp. TaxID=512312 RepID=UPI00260AF9D1|nr:hypothetical protein [uncultured Parabacteroides sp.]
MEMKLTNLVRRTVAFLVVGIMATCGSSVFAQEDKYKDYREVFRDTTDYVAPTELNVYKDSILDPLRVVTNRFGKNWFVFATGGVHSFRGDYSNWGKFKGTLSPDWGIGVGKWFTPGIGLKMEFIRSNSRGYTAYENGHYGYGDLLYTADGTPYRKMKTGWWDISGSAILNLSRLFLGYEGYDSPKRMNQFMLNLGIGGVHHMGYEHSHGSDNEWSGHMELQYSRFFNRKKRFSLDIKARGIFYQTNFDLEYGQADHAAFKWDCNLGIDIGFTFYLDKQRSNGWGRSTTQFYQRDYRERKIMVVKVKEKPVQYGTVTFYVFYPNNYSGRNDAPQVQGATVNALDYLAGGIFTQKQYVNNGEVADKILKGASLNGLAIKDIPTEEANRDFEIDYVPRGYEMSDVPLSLSLDGEKMTAFREKAGFYYAPIFDGLHTWRYRIDNETLKQQLISNDNYMETASFGLNAHRGLEIIRKNMDVDSGDKLVSFADVYAAMKSDEGYISRFTDENTVKFIKRVLDEGVITLIQAEGLATSQDNFTGADAENVGIERNTALSQNRANTVISWLKENERLNDVASQIFMVNSLNGPIRTVTDKSTRGLNAKLNRCVKVRIHYMMK